MSIGKRGQTADGWRLTAYGMGPLFTGNGVTDCADGSGDAVSVGPAGTGFVSPYLARISLVVGFVGPDDLDLHLGQQRGHCAERRQDGRNQHHNAARDRAGSER